MKSGLSFLEKDETIEINLLKTIWLQWTRLATSNDFTGQYPFSTGDGSNNVVFSLGGDT